MENRKKATANMGSVICLTIFLAGCGASDPSESTVPSTVEEGKTSESPEVDEIESPATYVIMLSRDSISAAEADEGIATPFVRRLTRHLGAVDLTTLSTARYVIAEVSRDHLIKNEVVSAAEQSAKGLAEGMGPPIVRKAGIRRRTPMARYSSSAANSLRRWPSLAPFFIT
jgi:PBP1b-binding outer membrane lipoprotein LpoB